MKKTENLYLRYQKEVKDKDTALLTFINNTLAKLQSMFVYTGLPETIPSDVLEMMLQTNGHCFVTKVGNDLYALKGTLGGTPDAYNRPTLYTVANPFLKLDKSFTIETDGVLVKNDVNGIGLLPIIGKFGVLYVDSVITLNVATVLSRITMLISASDDKTKQSADEFVKKITDGEFSVVGENAFFKGVNMQAPSTRGANDLAQLIENVQYVKASCYNELGLNANFNMKRERLNMGEVELNTDALFPFVDNMLTQRQQAVDAINEKYGTEITVNLGSSWNYNHESLENTVEQVNTENAPTEPKDDEPDAPTPDAPETDETKENAETDETPETDETEETPETDETKEPKS